jgi:hypothetical protein
MSGVRVPLCPPSLFGKSVKTLKSRRMNNGYLCASDPGKKRRKRTLYGFWSFFFVHEIGGSAQKFA